MILARFFAYTAILFAVSFSTTSLTAQEPGLVSQSDFDALMLRVDSHESLLMDTPTHVVQAKPFCNPCSTQAGMELGAEVVLLRPYQSEGEAPGFNLFAAPRVWLGYAGERGLGARVRWFSYQADNPENDDSAISDLDLTVLDFELTDKFRLGHWNGILSGGLRYADYEEIDDSDYSSMEDSFGLVVGLSVNRQCNDQWALFGLARTSFQFAADGFDEDDPESDVFFGISEIQLGVERLLWKNGGGRLSLRTVFEGQKWSGGLISGDSEDLGLVGGSVGLVFAR